MKNISRPSSAKNAISVSTRHLNTKFELVYM